MTNFKVTSSSYTERVDSLLKEWISDLSVAPRLQDAMHYSVFNGGKRIRPTLVLASADTISKANTLTLVAAAAIECIHAYSLIHDDLPAMDDDDLRRGKPTCHVQFDEATAILAGDALQSLAFEHLARACSESGKSADMVALLAQASGANGMVGGQMLDLQAEKNPDIDFESLKQVHEHKTGALIESAVLLGAMSVDASTSQLVSLKRYASALGLAFQVQDDIIDLTSDTETLGKTQGADHDRNKSTYVSLLGLEESRRCANELIVEAKAALAELAESASVLMSLADFCIARDR